MNYKSTRSHDGQFYSSAEVIKQGLARDGGLFMPESIPVLTSEEIFMLTGMDYRARAAFILGKFLTDYTKEELDAAANAAYGEPNFPSTPTPIAKLGDEACLLELWHGPTCAFKDMALQIMPRLLSLALEKTGEPNDALILVATSGDTGKAALDGFADLDRVGIHVFYPCDGVSEIQKKQMVTQRGANVKVTAVHGNFDDCQNGVKRIFADKSIAAELKKKGLFLSSANSINWGRLVPQVVYYVSACCDLLSEGVLAPGDIVNITVPTGNFGNILACYIAKKMGMPIGKLVCASNKNRVLTDFFETGVYDRRREFYTTTSPSMDILISSNLERLIYLVSGAERCAEYMNTLSKTGCFTVDSDCLNELRRDFAALSCDEEGTARTIAYCFEKYGYLCDTHTAVGLDCALRFKEKDETVMLVASTASPYKFADAVLAALGASPAGGFASLDMLSELTKTCVPPQLAALKSAQVRFNKTISPDEMPSEVLNG